MFDSANQAAFRRSRGVSLVEVSIASFLTGMLFLMVASLWGNYGRVFSDTIAHARVITEAEMVVESLRRDLAGSLPGASSGPRDVGACVGLTVVAGRSLLICFDGAPIDGIAAWGLPDSTIRYEVDNGTLIRSDLTDGTEYVVAGLITDWRPRHLGDTLQIEFAVEHRGFRRDYRVESPIP